MRCEPIANLGALFRSRLARVLLGLDDKMRLRRLRPVLPDLVDGVLVDRDQFGLGWNQLGMIRGLTTVNATLRFKRSAA